MAQASAMIAIPSSTQKTWGTTMARFFTYYWAEKGFEEQKQHCEGKPFDHVAGNGFRARGINPNDFLYLFSRSLGRIFLIARMQVQEILGQKQAEDRLRTTNLWKAKDHVLGEPNAYTIAQFDRVLSLDQLQKLRFFQKGKEVPLKFTKKGTLDGQTLRQVRELTPASAASLDNLIDKSVDGSLKEAKPGTKVP